MKRLLLSAGLALALTGFVYAQDNTQSSPTTTTQSTTSSSPATSAPAAPAGTKVTGHPRDTIVQPIAKPVKITPSVVKATQQKLTEDGYQPGPADGVMGPNTRAALQKFQSDQGLNASGRLDQETLAKLNVGGMQTIKSAPADLARGGKALGTNVSQGHPVAAGKAGAKGATSFGKKVAQGSESEAVKVKDKVGSGLSTIGEKISGAGEKTKNAGEASQQKPDENSSNPPQ